LGETIDAVVAMIGDPDISVEGLMKHIKGPDFPTGAFVVGRSGIRDAYRTGRGRIIMRARAHIEELRGGKSAVVITELPYGVKKGGDTRVIVKIADLVRDKQLTEAADLADHSDRSGMRLQLELERDAALEVALIRAAADVDEARTGLIDTLGFSEVQAQAILDLRLRALTALERNQVEAEYKDLSERIAELRAILGDPARIDGLIREELLEIRQIYTRADDRRTEIVAAEEELELEDMIAEEDMVIAITRSNYIKRQPVTAYREPR